jgi:hypothetical protein
MVVVAGTIDCNINHHDEDMHQDRGVLGTNTGRHAFADAVATVYILMMMILLL